MKYNPCCDKRCLVHGCQIREEGGCYCLCRLMDHLSQIKSASLGHTIYQGGGIIFYPDIEEAKSHLDRLSEEDKHNHLDRLAMNVEFKKKILEKIKTYEKT